jgi:hypothetical protein
VPKSALLVLTFAAAACAAHVTPPASAPPTGPFSAQYCGDSIEGSARLRGPRTVALFGEVHGTAEIPALFGRIVCNVAAAHEVLVGLEIPRDQQPLIDAFLASDGGAAAQAALRAGSFWHSAWKDGRSSQAMWALLEQLRAWRAAGARLSVVAFDIPEAAMATTADRDKEMADHLLIARLVRREAALLVLTGNIHARLRGGLEFAPDLVPMGATMRVAVPSLLSFDARYGAGTAWVCTGSTPAECGAEAWGRGEDEGPPRVERTGIDAYSGRFHVGAPLTASPPVVP